MRDGSSNVGSSASSSVSGSGRQKAQSFKGALSRRPDYRDQQQCAQTQIQVYCPINDVSPAQPTSSKKRCGELWPSSLERYRWSDTLSKPTERLISPAKEREAEHDAGRP